jgi:hypothetical protein
MKKFFITALTIFSILFFSQSLFAQMSVGTNSNHPTVESVKVKYKAVTNDSTQTATSNLNGIKAIPQATITIKQNQNINKIYFKLIKNADTIYQTNYLINSPVVYNANGIKLFEYLGNNKYFISSGVAINLKPYLVRVCTQDSLQTNSVFYSITQ